MQNRDVGKMNLFAKLPETQVGHFVTAIKYELSQSKTFPAYAEKGVVADLALLEL